MIIYPQLFFDSEAVKKDRIYKPLQLTVLFL